MPTIAEVRQKYPQYADMSDDQLGQALHKKYYSDMPFTDFASKIGLGKQRFGTGKSFDVMEDGSLAPTESVHYTGSGVVPASSGIAQREKKYGTNAGFNFGITPENLRDTKSAVAAPIRGAWKGVTGVPGLAADMGVSARNAITGSNYELPTQMQERALDQTLPLSGVSGDQTLEFLTSMAAGAKIPAPSIANQAPKGFIKPATDLVKQQTLAAGQGAGLVVPPSTTNPTALNKILESVGGKIATAQDAAARNISKFTNFGKSAVGMSEDTPLTQEGLSAVRKEAGDAYEVLRGAGDIVTDAKYTDDLAAVTKKFTGAAKDFPTLAKSDVSDLVAGVTKDKFSSDSAVDLLSILRDNADKAYRAGDAGLGKAYKSVSKAIEDVIQRNLSAAGKPELVEKFKSARQLIAKTHSVEGAFNPATGNVVGTKLAAQLTKKKPLSGDLKMAARFAQAFPKASAAIDDSGSVRNTDVIMGAGTSAVSGQPWWLLYPFVRQSTRNFLLSPAGQRLAVPGGPMTVPEEPIMGLLSGAEQLRR